VQLNVTKIKSAFCCLSFSFVSACFAFTKQHLPMQLINDRPSGFQETKEGIIKVKLWEAFLLYNRHNLYQTLATYSLDNGPLEKEDNDLATVSFRFMLCDWNNTLRDLLDQNNVPVLKESITQDHYNLV
jgi:hypothetical protein